MIENTFESELSRIKERNSEAARRRRAEEQQKQCEVERQNAFRIRIEAERKNRRDSFEGTPIGTILKATDVAECMKFLSYMENRRRGTTWLSPPFHDSRAGIMGKIMNVLKHVESEPTIAGYRVGRLIDPDTGKCYQDVYLCDDETLRAASVHNSVDAPDSTRSSNLPIDGNRGPYRFRSGYYRTEMLTKEVSRYRADTTDTVHYEGVVFKDAPLVTVLAEVAARSGGR